MKLKYIMNTEMWIPGAGELKRGDIIEEHNKKKIDKLLKLGMFKRINPKRKNKKVIKCEAKI